MKDDDRRASLAVWYANNTEDVPAFEKQLRRKMHYEIHPDYLWSSIAELARTQKSELLQTLECGFKYIESESFASTFQGLFSEINLNSEKLGRTPAERNKELCTIISKIAEGIAQFSTDSDILGDAYARRVSMAEIEKNDFNLNISRYVSTAVAEEEVDLKKVNADLISLEKKVSDARNKHNKFLKELGLPPLL